MCAHVHVCLCVCTCVCVCVWARVCVWGGGGGGYGVRGVGVWDVSTHVLEVLIVCVRGYTCHMLTHQHFGVSDCPPNVLYTRLLSAAKGEEAMAMRHLKGKGRGGARLNTNQYDRMACVDAQE